MYFHSVEPPLRTVAEVFPEPVVRDAEAAGVPIILHMPVSLPGGLNQVRELAGRRPHLKIILAHLGGRRGQTFTESIGTAFREIAQLPGVFMDTSFILDHHLIRAAFDAVGPTRLLFGTDEPLSLIRATAYLHPQLGPRLHAPGYHWCRDDDAPEGVSLRTPILLHIQILEAVIDAVDRDRASLQAIFHDNALRLFGDRLFT